MLSTSILFLVLSSLLASSLQDEFHRIEDIYKLSKTRLSGIGEDNLTPEEEKETSFWFDKAQNSVKERMNTKLNTNVAKNVIFFLGDGMSIATLAAARIRKGQLKGNLGEEEKLSFETFPFAGLSKTYCTNGQVADSACTSTAYLCGVKTNIMLLGVNANVAYNDCSASLDKNNQLESMYTWAQRAGKATGFVTTTTVTHASPSGGYAHVANRMWESDNDVKLYGANPSTCPDIATQLVTNEPGKNLKVVMGGGRGKMLPSSVVDISGKKGERNDGRNLIQEWQQNNPNGIYVDNRSDLLKTNLSKVDSLFGLFGYSNLDFRLTSDPVTQPTLVEMTKAAIQVVQKEENGFFLFIEGGLIDYGHHATMPGLALDEALEFDKAVELARSLTNIEDTLIIVSSDHSHTMSFAGYPSRGNDILDINDVSADSNGVPFFTLNYAIGPNSYRDATGKREDLTGQASELFVFPSNVPAAMGTHAGDDVGIFASGPHSHLFTSVNEQNLIPHLMAYAACIGNGATACEPDIRCE